uniref:POU domain protein n=1 Tax=Apteryx owenii TaxID=8824 RepID=A0A8B9QNZ7_APTOW
PTPRARYGWAKGGPLDCPPPTRCLRPWGEGDGDGHGDGDGPGRVPAGRAPTAPALPPRPGDRHPAVGGEPPRADGGRPRRGRAAGPEPAGAGGDAAAAAQRAGPGHRHAGRQHHPGRGRQENQRPRGPGQERGERAGAFDAQPVRVATVPPRRAPGCPRSLPTHRLSFPVPSRDGKRPSFALARAAVVAAPHSITSRLCYVLGCSEPGVELARPHSQLSVGQSLSCCVQPGARWAVSSAAVLSEPISSPPWRARATWWLSSFHPAATQEGALPRGRGWPEPRARPASAGTRPHAAAADPCSRLQVQPIQPAPALSQPAVVIASPAPAAKTSSAPVPITCSETPTVSQLVSKPQAPNASIDEDGINLEEIREFAKNFKIRRLSLGLTQTQVGQALTATEGPAYSQSAICRFEKLDITPKSAQKLKPVLEKWLSEAELRNQEGQQNLMEFVGGEPSKKRKRRTSFTPQAIEALNAYFEKNALPTGQEITEIAKELNYDREVVRVWFCNRRQTLKNTSKLNVFQIP